MPVARRGRSPARRAAAPGDRAGDAGGLGGGSGNGASSTSIDTSWGRRVSSRVGGASRSQTSSSSSGVATMSIVWAGLRGLTSTSSTVSTSPAA